MPEFRRNSFASRHLDPASRMGEILFGLIMTLTFTLAAGIVIQEEGREGAREMLIGILGCNLAWGIIDDEEARRMVADELDETLVPMADASARRNLYDAIVDRVRGTPIAPNPVRREDVMGGLAAAWLVFACSIPAVLPFLFLDDPRLALRVSNVILIGLLFLVGWRAARHTLAKPWLAGLTFMLLVAIAIPLGG